MAAAPTRKQAAPEPPPPVGDEFGLAALHRYILGCRRCVEQGLLERAAPVLAAPAPAGIVLVGQAPGRVEEGSGRPFSGRAGRLLFRWFARAGLGDEESARRLIYLTSITKCFPGPAGAGAGDRRPSAREVELCRGHLDRQLGLLRPWLILPVGQMALERFLGRLSMELAVGRLFSAAGDPVPPAKAATAAPQPLLLPLPHPSGASRWLNEARHQELLSRALALLGQLARRPPGEFGGDAAAILQSDLGRD